MATYAIGDIHGCFDAFRRLLDKLRFDPAGDRLWLVGDLVNRGLASLEVLRFVRDLNDSAVTVLGNHDLHLLAVVEGIRQMRPDSSLMPVLEAHDREALTEWLRQRPLLHHDPQLAVTLVHAGLAPQWDLAQARQCAREAEVLLQGPEYRALLTAMYGDTPARWSPDLEGMARQRFILNALTRIRLVTADGALDFRHSGPPGHAPADYRPWYELCRARGESALVFGHWAALGGHLAAGLYGVDTGCAWGNALTAVRLDDDEPHRTAVRVSCAS